MAGVTLESEEKDKVQIGLTPGGLRALETVGPHFEHEGDAFRFGVAYALGSGLTVNDAPAGGYGTKFTATQLDRQGSLRDLIATLLPECAARPYATAERLAEAGLVALARRLAAHETLSDVLISLQGEAAADPHNEAPRASE